jgi:hypothetical protein
MATKSTTAQKTPERQPARQGQLTLVVDHPTTNWHLDEETREIGLKGLAQARAVLSASRPIMLEPAA